MLVCGRCKWRSRTEDDKIIVRMVQRRLRGGIDRPPAVLGRAEQGRELAGLEKSM